MHTGIVLLVAGGFVASSVTASEPGLNGLLTASANSTNGITPVAPPMNRVVLSYCQGFAAADFPSSQSCIDHYLAHRVEDQFTSSKFASAATRAWARKDDLQPPPAALAVDDAVAHAESELASSEAHLKAQRALENEYDSAFSHAKGSAEEATTNATESDKVRQTTLSEMSAMQEQKALAERPAANSSSETLITMAQRYTAASSSYNVAKQKALDAQAQAQRSQAQAHDSERRAIAAGDAHHSVADQVASVRASTQEVVKAAHTKKESKLSLQHHASEAANIAAESAIVSVIAAESVKAAAYAGKNSTAKDGAAEQLRESKYALHTAMASADKHFHIMMHDDTFVPLPPTKKVVAEQIETADVPLSVGQMADLRKIAAMKETNLVQANLKLGAFIKNLQMLYPKKSDLEISNLFGQAFDVAISHNNATSQVFGFDRAQVEGLPAYRKLHRTASPFASVFGTQARRMQRDMGD